MLKGFTQENTIGAVQTLLTALTLRKIGKGYHWPLLGGLALLELPLRFMDDGDNPTGRETFLLLLSFVYVLLVGLTRVFLKGVSKLVDTVSYSKRPAPAPVPQAQSTFTSHEPSLDEIAYFIQEAHPTIDELVSQYGDSREALFAVLEKQGGTEGDLVVLV